MQISFLRHGKSRSAGTYTGSSDISLSKEGEEEIIALAHYIQNQWFDICYCSPLKRCTETYNLLGCPIDCEIFDELSEIDFGRWEGLTFAQISRDDPQNLDRWMNQKDKFTFPEGESIPAFAKRVKARIDVIRNSGHEKILIISHGGVIKTAISHLLRLNRSDCFDIAEGSVSTVFLEEQCAYLSELNCKGV